MDADCKRLLDAVECMRRLQRDFFRTKRRDLLEQSLQAERAVDEILRQLRGGQMNLFRDGDRGGSPNNNL